MARNRKREISGAQTPPDFIKRGIADEAACDLSIRAVAQELNMPSMAICRFVKQAKEFGLCGTKICSTIKEK